MDLKTPTQPANRKRKTTMESSRLSSKRGYSRSKITYHPMDQVEVILDGGQAHPFSTWTPAQFDYYLPKGIIDPFDIRLGASTVNNCLIQYWRKQNDGWSMTYVAENQMRPCPPQYEEIEFKRLDVVDAFVDNSWWVGTIIDICADNYTVTLNLTNEYKEFNSSQLRHHCDWIDGKWEFHVRDGTVLVIDVGPSMHKALPHIERLCSMLVENKLIYSKSDEVGVVLFGTEGTENVLTRQVGGYDHITVLRDIKVVDEDLIQAVEQLPRGTHNGDFLDAVIVGMDMLIKKYGETNKGKKRLCLFTNAHYPTKAPLEGSKEDQVIIIAGCMNTQGMRLESIVIRGGLTGEAKKSIMDENDHLLDIFSKRTCAKLVHVETPASLLGALKTRKVAPVTIFRGDLELTPKMKIKVWVYKKTSEDKFPTLKKYSDRAAPIDKYATHAVKVEFEYKSAEDLSKVVPPEQRIKSYHYGPQVIPISSAEWDAVMFKPEKSVKLLGFSDAQNILRHYYMKDVNIFIPEPGNTKAILAVSALARAMKDMNKVAIVHCVWRQGQESVVVGALTPNVSDNYNIPDSFYFNVLPFTEDVRQFQFPSFNNFPAAWQPNEQQQESADDFVRMFDLASPGKQEVLLPDLTLNPVLERFFHHLELKSRGADAAVPPIAETLRKISEPDKDLIAANKSVVDAFRSRFEVKENPKLKKSSRRQLKKNPSASNEGDDHMDISDQPNSNEHTSGIKVTTIGDSAPVQDFEAILSCRDSPEWFNKAIKDMQNKIHDLVENSHEGDNYPKALECLIALRKGCILEQEPNKFNDFLQSLCKFCQDKYLSSFCDFLATKDLTLIPKTEAMDSEVTNAEARSFLVKSEPKLE